MSLSQFSVLAVVVLLLMLGIPLLRTSRDLSGALDSDIHVFVADVVHPFDTVDGGMLDYVLSRLGLPGWFRHVYFEYHAKVRLRFKLASGLGRCGNRGWGHTPGLSFENGV